MAMMAKKVIEQVEIMEGDGLEGEVKVTIERIDPYTFKEEFQKHKEFYAKSLVMRPIKHQNENFELDFNVALEDITYKNETVNQTLHLIGR